MVDIVWRPFPTPLCRAHQYCAVVFEVGPHCRCLTLAEVQQLARPENDGGPEKISSRPLPVRAQSRQQTGSVSAIVDVCDPRRDARSERRIYTHAHTGTTASVSSRRPWASSPKESTKVRKQHTSAKERARPLAFCTVGATLSIQPSSFCLAAFALLAFARCRACTSPGVALFFLAPLEVLSPPPLFRPLFLGMLALALRRFRTAPIPLLIPLELYRGWSSNTASSPGTQLGSWRGCPVCREQMLLGHGARGEAGLLAVFVTAGGAMLSTLPRYSSPLV